MKHILIILTLGILGTGLYWVASSGHSSPASPASSETAASAQSQSEAPNTPGTHQKTTPEPAQVSGEETPADTPNVETVENSPSSAAPELPSTLNRYQRVLRDRETSTSRSTNTTASKVTVGQFDPNTRLQSYEATLNLLSE